jgi:hypothetical protein
MNNRVDYAELATTWHRRLSGVTEHLWVSGDLHPNEREAAHQIGDWREREIKVIIDLREELSDEALIDDLAPDLTYVSLGTHDNGSTQSDDWFAKGVDMARWAATNGEAILFLSHMGVSRAPAMALRVLLDEGWNALQAATWIRSVRPITSLAYALDALDHHQRTAEYPVSNDERSVLDAWLTKNPVDLPAIIGRIHRTVVSWVP